MDDPFDRWSTDAPRADAEVLTDFQPGWTDTFNAAWPRVTPRLAGYLRRRGVGADEVDDILQDLALRVVERQLPFGDDEDLLRWCYVVARNLATDASRRRRPTSGELTRDLEDSYDVHEHVRSRLRWHRVVTVFPQLSNSDQEALLSAFTGQDLASLDRQTQVRLAVRRHRARSRLTALLGSAYGVLLGCLGAARRSATPVALAVTPVVLLIMQMTPQNQPAQSGPMDPDGRSETTISQVSLADDGRGEGLSSPPTGESARSVREVDADVNLRKEPGAASSAVTASRQLPLDGNALAITAEEYEAADGRLVCAGGLPVQETCLYKPKPMILDPSALAGSSQPTVP